MSTPPLDGCRILVTRPEAQAPELCEAIESAGGIAVRFPVIRIEPRDPEAVAGELATLAAPDFAIFVSRSAVEYGLDLFRDRGATLVAVGPATAAEIETRGLTADLVPQTHFDSEHLLSLPGLQSVAGKSVVIVRGDSGRQLLGETLATRGAKVTYLSVYRRMRSDLPAERVEEIDRSLQHGDIDCVTVMSVATLQNLLELLSPGSRERLRKTPLVAPGDRVIQTACQLLPGVPAITASGPRPADILNALLNWRLSGTG